MVPNYKRIWNISVYTCKLSQSNTDDPTIIMVLQNTLEDTPTWDRTGVGIYTCNITNGQFIDINTVVEITNLNVRGSATVSFQSTNQIEIRTYDSTGTLSDNILFYTNITIKISNGKIDNI